MFENIRQRIAGAWEEGQNAFCAPGLRITVRAMNRRDAQRIAQHFKRLPPDDRRTRFFLAMNDSAIESYSARLDWENTVVFGAFANGVLRGVGELVPQREGSDAELAVTVEPGFRHVAIGRLLVSALLVEARVGKLREVRLVFLRENDAIRALARDAGARLVSNADLVEAILSVDSPE